MVLPYTCECGASMMLDYENLESRPLPKLWEVEGYVCERCQQWKPVFYTNARLNDKLRKLSSTRHKSFNHTFFRTLQSARAAQLAGQELRDGSSTNSHLATS